MIMTIIALYLSKDLQILHGNRSRYNLIDNDNDDKNNDDDDDNYHYSCNSVNF